MDPVELLALLGGVAEAESLVGRYRASRRALASAVTDGRILRIRRGCYALPGADPLRVAEVAWRGLATCITVARELGLPVLSNDSRLHLHIAGNRTFSAGHLRPLSHVRVHYVQGPLPQHITLREAIDASTTCLSPEQQLVLVDAALRNGGLLRTELSHFEKTPQRRKTWLIRYADDRAESPIETLARLAMRRAGLTVESQVQIQGVGRVDFLVEGRVIVEADGRSFHSDAISFASDRRRDRAAAALGLPVLRFTYAEIMADAYAVAQEVQRLCKGGPPYVSDG